MFNYDFEELFFEDYFAGIVEDDNSDDCYHDTMES